MVISNCYKKVANRATIGSWPQEEGNDLRGIGNVCSFFLMTIQFTVYISSATLGLSMLAMFVTLAVGVDC